MMSGGGLAALVIVLALAIVPMTIAYVFLVANHIVPRLRRLPGPAARMLTAACLVFPWVVISGIVWALTR